MRPRGAIASLLLPALVLVGCDPGWTYHDAGANRNPSLVRLRAGGFLFAGGLSVTVSLENLAGESLYFREIELHAQDARGVFLPAVGEPSVASDCTLVPSRNGPALAPGRNCKLEAYFNVRPTVPSGWWAKRTPNLRRLMISITGIVGERMQYTLEQPMEWDL